MTCMAYLIYIYSPCFQPPLGPWAFLGGSPRQVSWSNTPKTLPNNSTFEGRTDPWPFGMGELAIIQRPEAPIKGAELMLTVTVPDPVVPNQPQVRYDWTHDWTLQTYIRVSNTSPYLRRYLDHNADCYSGPSEA